MQTIRFVILFIPTTLVLLFWSATVQGSTNVCGNITVNTTWTVADSPYIATCSVTINSGVTLTIDPAVMVKFASGTRLLVNGKLTAIGTAGNPITFTSNAATPTAGSWRSIYFGPTANPTSRISYATFSYGGATDLGGIRFDPNYTGIWMNIDNLTVSNSSSSGIYLSNAVSVSIDTVTISNCSGAGVTVAGVGTNILNSTINNNGTYGVNYTGWGWGALINNTISNNGNYAIGADSTSRIDALASLTLTGNGGGTKNAVGLRGGSTTPSGVWHSGANWDILGTITIGSTSTLTIDPGVTARFASGTRLLVNGKLTAVGTAGNPITFTSNAATPTAGSWRSIYFGSTANPTSRISYATFSYGGATDLGAIRFDLNYTGIWMNIDNLTVSNSSSSGIYLSNAVSVSIDTVTINNCSGAGVTVAGVGANILNSTINNNGTNGVNYTGWGWGALINNTISDNGNYAIGADSTSRIDSLASLTLTGNGGGTKNAVGLRGGSTTPSGVWHSGANWDILGTITIGSTSTLTIDPGVTARFAPDKFIDVYGALIAVGSAQQPILFTSNATTPSPGSWGGLYYRTGSSASQIKYATLSYAGDAQYSGYDGAIVMDGGFPALEHLTITYSSTKAIKITQVGVATPNIKHCTFMNNTGGAITNENATTIDAKLNYWSSTNGPSGAGSGSGQSISTNVQYDPFFSAAPVNPHLFSSAVVINQTFNPANGVNISIPFETTMTGDWTASFKNAIGTVLRTYSGSGQTATVVWDGKDSYGTLLLDGTYNFELQSTASPSGEIAASVKGAAIVIDSTKLLAISSFTVGSAYFSPNNDGIQETTSVLGSFNFDDVNWTLNFRDSTNAIVRSTSGMGSSFSYVWDGKDSSAVVQPDGGYLVELLVVDGTMNNGSTKPTTVDSTFPVSQILYPNGGGILSNFYQSASMDVAVNANSTDLNYQNWVLESGSGATPATWSTLASGTSPASGNSIHVWATENLTNGIYTLRLQTWDKAGNRTAHTTTLIVGNFKVSMNVQQINATTGQTVQYTSILPFTLTETIVIKNSAGEIVRTLLNGVSRNAGSYVDSWNGKTAAGAYLPTGGYFYVATVTDGTNSMTWDLTGQTASCYDCQLTIYPVWDPFNNSPLIMTVPITAPKLLVIAFSPYYDPVWGPGGGLIEHGCAPPNYCFVNYEHREIGTHIFRWAGVDNTGAFRTDFKGYTILKLGMNENVVVVYGTRLNLTTPLTASPALFYPYKGPQTLSFTFNSFQSQSVSVIVTVVNQSSVSTLRTINMTGVNPGNITITWDGKADNAMWVAPGTYTLTVQLADSIGNTVSGQILTTVRY